MGTDGRAGALGSAAAEVLGGRICAAASLAAQADAQQLELIGDFDAGNAVRWFAGVASLAHWLSWACSMAPGADREHAARQHAQRSTTIDNVVSFHHPDAQCIQPGWCGERYDRHEAVQAVFRMPRREAA